MVISGDTLVAAVHSAVSMGDITGKYMSDEFLTRISSPRDGKTALARGLTTVRDRSASDRMRSDS
ncbi:hypothetical protein EA462_03385 [Natrarchaeobius halalkaliphilus]|uniref:Uncharacterized protein n=1 Tax=Natrarchaeobius halalkaliphilus TaxID=1679091 RepID=A0A3N6LT86_9EURY|nr:hypothetical protein EA462_03385 [Natrarchaeobius halalkaliphilus]